MIQNDCGPGVGPGATAVIDESYTVDAVDSHEQTDPVANLVERIRLAAERRDALAAGARVKVRRVAAGAFKVERQ